MTWCKCRSGIDCKTVVGSEAAPPSRLGHRRGVLSHCMQVCSLQTGGRIVRKELAEKLIHLKMNASP